MRRVPVSIADALDKPTRGLVSAVEAARRPVRPRGLRLTPPYSAGNEVADRALRRMYPRLGRRRLHVAPGLAIWKTVWQFIRHHKSAAAANAVVVPETLAWADINYTLTFVPLGLAHERAEIHRIVNAASSWEELLARLPDAYAQEARNIMAGVSDDEEWDKDDEWEEGEDEHDPTDGWLELLAEAVFPGWLEQEMLRWVPDSIQEQFGTRGYSMCSGECLTLNSEDTDAIVRAFEDLGYRCVRRQTLVQRASGY